MNEQTAECYASDKDVVGAVDDQAVLPNRNKPIHQVDLFGKLAVQFAIVDERFARPRVKRTTKSSLAYVRFCIFHLAVWIGLI